MNERKSTIGMPIEQGFYTLILGIVPEGQEPIYFYDSSNEKANYCTIYGLNLHESISDIVPTCKIEVEVPYTWLDNQYLTDGTLVTVELKLNDELPPDIKKLNEKAYVFRLFGIEKIEDHGIFVRVILNCVIDFLAGYGDGNVLNCPCTTSKVFENCATEYKFTEKDIDNTKDAQLWIANGRNIYQFLSYCCQYGWADDTSAMMWAIDRNKKLYYKNIVKCFNPNNSGAGCSSCGCAGGTCQNVRVGSLGVPVVSSVPFGLNNVKLGAYGIDADVFNFMQDDKCEYDYKNILSNELTKTSESTCVCKNGPAKQGQGWFPFNVGNHNENYFKALTQNRQILATYSTFLSVRFSPSTAVATKNSILPFFEAFHLFDTCNIEYDVHAENDKFIKMESLSAKCMVASIDVNVTQKHAATKIQFVMQGFNTKGKTN